MKWFFERVNLPSEKNGSIRIERTLGTYQVSVDGCGQTTSYTNSMWADAFRRVSYHTPRVLLLGLGAGGSIPLLHKQFYNCDITAVEHDPAMVALTRTVGAYKPFPFPYVVEEDASTAVHQLSGLFDIIIIDLFNGPEPSLLATDKAFLQALKKLLSHTGTLLINVYKRPKYLHTARTLFLKANEWKFAENTLGSFTDNV